VGERLLGKPGPAEAVGTHYSSPPGETLHFDATGMGLGDIISPDSQFSHCFIVFSEADIDACKADIDRSHKINVIGIKKIIDSMINRGIKPIFMSSEYVFDGGKGNYTEGDLPTPNTVYGGQKREIEVYLEESASDYAVLRLAKVYGTDPTDHTIFSGWAIQIQRGEQIRCARDQVFSGVHLDDVVSASIEEVARLDPSGVFNIAGPGSYSRLGMLRTSLAHLEVEADVLEFSIRDIEFLDNRPMGLSMDPSLVQSATGLRFQSVDDCCREFISNLKKEEASTRG